MEQSKTSTYPYPSYTSGGLLKRALSIQVPRVKPIAQLTMSSYNHRNLSPGGRRLTNPGRASDNNVTSDGYYQQRHSTYASPRTSTSGVIPISTQTFINVPQAQPSPAARQYLDAYSGRPRRSSHADQTRGVTASSSTTALPSRSRPTVIQQEVTRPASPTKIAPRDVYVTSNSSQEPRSSTTTTHKKLYSVDTDGSAKLVADVNIPAGGDRHHKRRESTEKSGYRMTAVDRERDRGRRGAAYHTNGSHNRPRDKSIEDEDAYSYTDPASMYRDTEPRWREVQRPRRGSLDRGSRERPISMIDPILVQRQAVKESGGPPPSTRGWDKINDTMGRTSSVRDAPRPVAQSPTRGRHAGYADYGDSNDAIYVPRNSSTEGRRTTIHNYDSNYDYTREPRAPVRRNSVTRRPDPSLERRGFGINPNLRDDSQTRYGRRDGRGSDESFEHTLYRDSGYAEPMRRETAPQPYTSQYQDTSRLEQEKRDREYALRLQAEDQTRTRDRDVREPPVKQLPRREDDRGHDRDYDRPRDRDHDRLTERERERDRYVQPPVDRKDDRKEERRDERKDDRDRHHVRRDTDRDRDYGRKKDKEDSPRRSGEAVSKPSLSQAATGGLAGAAAAFGLTGLINKVTDKRDKDKDPDDSRERGDRERDRSRDRRADRERQERERERDRDRPERFDDDRERHRDDRREVGRAASDEDRYGRDRERDRPHREEDRGLGFAFEAPPEPPRTAPLPSNDRQQGTYPPPERAPVERPLDRPQERPVERPSERSTDRPNERLAPVAAPERPSSRQGERSHHRPESERTRDSDSDSRNGRTDMPAAPMSAEEDYRRRMEQVQRELGVASAAQRAADADPDRERRKREREQRQRERELRNGGSNVPYPDSNSSSNTIPIPSGTRGSFDRDDVSNVTGMTGTTAHDSVLPDLHRKPSILDRPMTDEPYQIIDNSQSDRRENRVRIVDPPTEQEDKRPKGILKKPTEKFPEDNHAIREGVAPLKDVSGFPYAVRL